MQSATGASWVTSSDGSRPLAMRMLLYLAALTVVLAGVGSVSDIVGPIFLALVLTITLHPIRTWLESKRLPELAASIVMLLGAYLVLFLLTLALIVSVAQLAALIPEYTDQINSDAQGAESTLEALGLQQDQIQAIAHAIDPGQIVDAAMGLLEGTLGVLGNVFFLITVLLFMTFDTDATRRCIASIGTRLPGVVTALESFARGARSYMSVSAGFGLIVAVLDFIALSVLDVPGAFVWAVLSFVTNFIPNIGFIIGVIPPALIALLDGGVGQMVVVIVVYSVINFVIQSIIQPRVVGDAVGLSATLTFLSLVFWTWVIGPLGALLAVPLSLLARALLVEADPNTRWALPIIAGKPVEDEPPESSAENA